jgi:CPA2 family monovalent cation:H+ antiporter-2
MEAIGLQSVLILLGVAVVLVALFRYLHLPQILAYLCAGALVGPYGFGWIPNLEATRHLAEFGLVFLMFTLGLEFSLAKLLAMRVVVFGLGGAQVLLTSIAFAAAAWLLKVPVEGAMVIGGMFAVSSTAIAMKQLTEQLEQNSRHGRHALGVLLFQDLAVVPFLILIPTLGGDAASGSLALTLGTVLVKSLAVLAVILFAGRWLLRPLLHEVASARLREFFLFTALLLTLAAAYLTERAGLSLALGAFLAGMMLAETEYRHQLEGDIAPFRDILLGLFFVTIGMMLDVAALVRDWPLVLGLAAGILVFKTVLITALARLFRIETGVALRTGLVLSQVGEFAFAMLLQADRYALLGAQATQVVLAAVVLTMLAAPLMIRYSGAVARRLVPSYQRMRQSSLEVIRAEAAHADRHVIICGYGRSGQNLGFMLEQEGIPHVALDLDPVRVRDARDAGRPVVYGYGDRRDVLEAAGLARARALAVSFNNVTSALKILEITRLVRPDMPVVVRTMDDADLERLKQAGATEVVPESVEGSLMIGSHLLLLLGVPMSHIVRQVRDARMSRYRMMRGYFHGQDAFEEKEAAAYRDRLHSVSLPATAGAVGKRIEELRLDELGVSVSAVRRGGIRGPEPGPETKLMAGDVLVLFGTPEALEQAEQRLLAG